MRTRHLDVDGAGFEDLADQFVRFLGSQFGPFALGDVDAGDNKSAFAGWAIRDEEPTAVGMSEFLLPEFAAVPCSFVQPFIDFVSRNGKLVALRGHAKEIEPVYAWHEDVRAYGVHLAI